MTAQVMFAPLSVYELGNVTGTCVVFKMNASFNTEPTCYAGMRRLTTRKGPESQSLK